MNNSAVAGESGLAEASPLGKVSTYRSDYAPELLFPIPRGDKRREIGVADALPFFGADLWHAYEVSWLNPRGKPVVALATFRVPAQSPCLVESKSLKLYLNSFNQTRCTDHQQVAATIARDLSAAAGAPVAVSLTPLAQRPQRRLAYAEGLLLDELDIDIDRYQPAPELLSAAPQAGEVSETLVSHLLKSNCLVTGQPDWASVLIRYVGAPMDHAGLLRYIVSFRNHNEFHEQCVERMFMDIQRQCRPRRLLVLARYTRRGGLDINPWRSSEDEGEPELMAQDIGDLRQ